MEANSSILQSETQELLLSFGVSAEEIERIKKEYIYKTTLKELAEIFNNFKNKDFDKIKLFYSPAGDGTGTDNHCLEFSCGEDIGKIIEKLKK